jgi:branched-chain amino acid transport system ATP-binding protein
MEYSDLLGGYPLTFLLFTLVIGGWLAFMTGNALAATWRPFWQVLPYAVLLGVAERFFNYALFGGALLSLTGLVIDTALIMVIAGDLGPQDGVAVPLAVRARWPVWLA